MFNPLFLDAMQVTLDLGYKYIWIDSLCIIQDAPDSGDWARECPSPDLREDWELCAGNAPGNGLQGGMLTVVRERLGNPGTPILPLSMFRTNSFRDAIPSSGCSAQDDRQKLLHNWYRYAVGNYSTTKLTYPQDKLPAISGLAAIYGRLLGTRYLAGHWEQHLLQSLSWTQNTNKTVPKAVGVAPSWSWASTNSPVTFRDLDEKVMPVSTIIHASAQRATSDPWGAVTTCRLRIRGPLQNLDRLRRSLAACPPGLNQWWADTNIPGLDDVSMVSKAIIYDQDADRHNIFLLPLFVNCFMSVRCLILKKVSRVDAKSFVRIGLYHMLDFRRPGDQMAGKVKYLGPNEVHEVFRGFETEEVEII
ncbi:HET-domain-containing protein [Apiospora rasikravindrae]|uniref:HET-domain-containing protein n=1 Tax=Apiospora rasikravindrae TaxID=990691 RepID=A0ABR1S576_9PEZI